MPHQLEGFKIAQRAGISSRWLVWVMAFVIVPAVFLAFLIYLYTLYNYGASVAVDAPGQVLGPASSTYNQLASWLQFPQPVDGYGIVAIILGFLFTMILGLLRVKFIWWPFHPAGYTLGTGFAIDDYWFTMVISSTIKWIILRHGGARTYRKSIPFFLGLVIGEYFVACGWALLGVIVGKPMYVVWA